VKGTHHPNHEKINSVSRIQPACNRLGETVLIEGHV
jgi:hypothetical protein